MTRILLILAAVACLGFGIYQRWAFKESCKNFDSLMELTLKKDTLITTKDSIIDVYRAQLVHTVALNDSMLDVNRQLIQILDARRSLRGPR